MLSIDKRRKQGFTIVELLVTIVIIGILSTLAFVSYRGVSQKAIVASIESDLQNISKQIRLYEVDNGAFPVNINDCPTPAAGNMCLKTSSGNTFAANVIDNATKIFCISIENGDQQYYITDNDAPAKGACLSATVNVLAVGGGGSGAASSTGGTGGSGGSVVSTNGVSVKATTTDIVVGTGGSSVATGNNGTVGSDSSFGNYVVAAGGAGGVTGSSSSASSAGTISTISGSSVTYAGGGGSSNSDYEKTVGGAGGGGGGVSNSAYGDGSKNLVSNGYAGLLYSTTGILQRDTTFVSNAGNFFGTNGKGVLSDIASSATSPIEHLPKNNSTASYALANSTANNYTFSPQIEKNRQVGFKINGGNLSGSVSITGLYFNFSGTQKSLAQAVTDGYIEPMVIINSGATTGSYYWANILNIYNNTATGNGNYPAVGVVFTLKSHVLTGMVLNLSTGLHATDGVMVKSWDRLGGISLSPIPSINGVSGLGAGGGANTADSSGAGGSGVVIISYPTGSVNATGGTKTTAGGNTIHTFTSNGTFTIVD